MSIQFGTFDTHVNIRWAKNYSIYKIWYWYVFYCFSL